MKFSVVVPIYNKEAFVVEAINSILRQQHNELEIIAIDDGSTDKSFLELSSIYDSRLKVLRQPNYGVAAARNLGISAAQGQYICFLDADDLWAPDHLAKIVMLIHEDPLAIAWATGYTEIDASSNCVQAFNNIPISNKNSCSLSQDYFFLEWARRPIFWTGSITIRKTTLVQLQPCFPSDERLGEDQDLWFRLSELGHIRFFDIRSTAYYRRNVRESLTISLLLEPLPALIRLRARASNKLPSELRAARHLFNIHLLHVAWNNCLAGRRIVALGFLWRAGPFARWTYWFRIFFCLLLPVNVVRYTMTMLRRIGTNSL